MKNVQIQLNGSAIHLNVEQKAVHIPITPELRNALELDLDGNTSQLVKLVQDEFVSSYAKRLEVSDDSMAVEIWGHLFMEDFLKRIDRLIPFEFLKKLSEKLIEKTSTIDIGESETDNNRFIWDMIAPYRKSIGSLLQNKEGER